MSQPNPLAVPEAWNLVADAYDKEVVRWFETFARRALELTSPASDGAVLDVACGPGTLSFLAAARVAKVVAIDFASEMIELLRARAAREGVKNIEAHVMDGQSLSLPDETFDAAYSMFGLMFFPDRLRGMREILRVLRAGAPAVISSWAPLDKSPIAAVGFGALRKAIPDLPAPAAPPPLQDPAIFEGVLRDAGFERVRVHVESFEQLVDSAEAYWDTFTRTTAPVVQLKQRLGADQWAAIDERGRAAVRAELGAVGPFKLGGFANLGLGFKAG